MDCLVQKPRICDRRSGKSLGKPFALNKKGVTKAHTHLITGYSIVEAKDIETVKVMVIDHPHLNQPKD